MLKENVQKLIRHVKGNKNANMWAVSSTEEIHVQKHVFQSALETLISIQCLTAFNTQNAYTAQFVWRWLFSDGVGFIQYADVMGNLKLFFVVVPIVDFVVNTNN